jgi:hypothetical protein
MNLFFFLFLVAIVFTGLIAFGWYEKMRRSRIQARDAPTLEEWIRGQLGDRYISESEIINRILGMVAMYIGCKPTQLRASDRFDNELSFKSRVVPDDLLNCVEEEIAELVLEITGRDLPIAPEQLDIADVKDVIDRVCEFVNAR